MHDNLLKEHEHQYRSAVARNDYEAAGKSLPKGMDLLPWPCVATALNHGPACMMVGVRNPDNVQMT